MVSNRANSKRCMYEMVRMKMIRLKCFRNILFLYFLTAFHVCQLFMPDCYQFFWLSLNKTNYIFYLKISTCLLFKKLKKKKKSLVYICTFSCNFSIFSFTKASPERLSYGKSLRFRFMRRVKASMILALVCLNWPFFVLIIRNFQRIVVLLDRSRSLRNIYTCF